MGQELKTNSVPLPCRLTDLVRQTQVNISLKRDNQKNLKVLVRLVLIVKQHSKVASHLSDIDHQGDTLGH